MHVWSNWGFFLTDRHAPHHVVTTCVFLWKLLSFLTPGSFLPRVPSRAETAPPCFTPEVNADVVLGLVPWAPQNVTRTAERRGVRGVWGGAFLGDKGTGKGPVDSIDDRYMHSKSPTQKF